MDPLLLQTLTDWHFWAEDPDGSTVGRPPNYFGLRGYEETRDYVSAELAFKRYIRALPFDAPDLTKRCNRGYLFDVRDSRHIVLLEAALPGYFWLGVENIYDRWSTPGTPVWRDDVMPLLKKWKLDGARWYWSSWPQQLTCPWRIPQSVFPKGQYWGAVAGAEAGTYRITAGQPWKGRHDPTRPLLHTRTWGALLNHKLTLAPVIAMAMRSTKSIERSTAKLRPYLIGHTTSWYMDDRKHVVLRELLKRGAQWIRRACLEGDWDPLTVLAEANYEGKRDAKQRAN